MIWCNLKIQDTNSKTTTKIQTEGKNATTTTPVKEANKTRITQTRQGNLSEPSTHFPTSMN